MTLHTESFVQGLVKQGVSHFCVVPCSFAKYIINEIINNPSVEYLPCASEAVACSIAAGLKMAGKNPIVIAQSSGLANMGSCITSLLKPYGIFFPILISWRSYDKGDSEIQHKHLATELPNLIQAYGYQYELLDTENLEVALEQITKISHGCKIGVFKKNSFTKVDLLPVHRQGLSLRTPRSVFLIWLNTKYANSNKLFIGTTGNCAREMYSFMPNTNNFYMTGNMGGALGVGFGAAKAGKKVIVCGGDAEFVMHMGGLVTAGRDAEKVNLSYLLFDNESNKSTGGQNTYQSHVDYSAIAQASNFNCWHKTINTVDEMAQALSYFETKKGLNFLHIKCGFDLETPRPPLEAVKKNKFMVSL